LQVFPSLTALMISLDLLSLCTGRFFAGMADVVEVARIGEFFWTF